MPTEVSSMGFPLPYGALVYRAWRGPERSPRSYGKRYRRMKTAMRASVMRLCLIQQGRAVCLIAAGAALALASRIGDVAAGHRMAGIGVALIALVTAAGSAHAPAADRPINIVAFGDSLTA